MDYGLLICLFVTWQSLRAVAVPTTPSILCIYKYIQYSLYCQIKIQIQCFKKRWSQTSLLSSQFNLKQHWFFKITSSNSASISAFVEEDTGLRIFVSGQARTAPASSYSWWTKYYLSKRNCWWCYLSRAATHGKSQENSDSISWPRSR